MKHFLFNFRKNFKINFGPQNPNRRGYLASSVWTSEILLLVSDQEVIPPTDKMNIALGGVIIIAIMLLLLHHPIEGKCLTKVCRNTKRNANLDPLKVTCVLRTKEGYYFGINVKAKTFIAFNSLSLADPKVIVIQSRLTLDQVVVALMLSGYWALLETQILYSQAKAEFFKDATQQLIIKLANAPDFETNLINRGYCSVCYNGYANLYLTEHLTIIQKFRP